MTSYLKSKILHTGNCDLKENNIDHIAWGPYNPKHQGVVKVFNKTIQDFLYQLRIVKEKNIV